MDYLVKRLMDSLNVIYWETNPLILYSILNDRWYKEGEASSHYEKYKSDIEVYKRVKNSEMTTK